MLNAIAHLDDQLQPLKNLDFLLIAVIGDRHSGHIFRNKVGLAGRRPGGMSWTLIGNAYMSDEVFESGIGAQGIETWVNLEIDQLIRVLAKGPIE